MRARGGARRQDLNGIQEVDGSIPFSSTKAILNDSRASAQVARDFFG